MNSGIFLYARNICTGGHNFCGRYEYVPVQSMEKVSSILVKIVKGFAK